MKRTWTRAEDATLRRLYPTMSFRAISEHLDRTPRAVKSRIEVLRLKKNTPITERKYDRIAHLALERFVKRHGTVPAEAGEHAMDYWIECLQKARKQVFL